METVPEVVGLPGDPPSVSPAAAAAAVLSLLDLNLIFGRCLLQLIQNSTVGGGFLVPDLAECNTGTGSCFKDQKYYTTVQIVTLFLINIKGII